MLPPTMRRAIGVAHRVAGRRGPVPGVLPVALITGLVPLISAALAVARVAVLARDAITR